MRRFTRKMRTREHILADLSVNHVERHVLRCGHVIQEVKRDYGIDLEVYTFSKKGESEAGAIRLQVKAVSRPKYSTRNQSVIYRLDRRDIASWLADPMPVILVVYDTRKDRAYWLYVQSYFAKLSEPELFALDKTVSVKIPVANILNRSAIRKFVQYRNRVLKQMKGVVHED